MTETPKKPKKYGNQVHLRLGNNLAKAIEERAKQEGITMTALMVKAAKQYLGWEEQSSQPTFNIDEVEERLFQRLSEQWVSYAIELEEKLHKSVSERVSEIDLAEIENRISQRVLECVSQQEDKGVSRRVPNLIRAQNEESLTTSPLSETANNTRVEEQEVSVSTTNTEIQIDHESSQGNASIPEERTIEITPTGVPLLFDSIGQGQIVKPSDIARYLNEIEQDSSWKLHKVRRLKNKQLTFLKKPLAQRKSEPPLPMIAGEYMIDWTPSEAFKNLDNTTSTGKSWWIQRLPSNPDEAEKLIAARRKLWNNPP